MKKNRFLLLLAFVALLVGMMSGLIRAGWVLPIWSSAAVRWHGAIMLVGFLGTLISLERAAALNKGAAYAAPVFFAIGAILLEFVPGAAKLGQVLFLAGSLGLVIIYGYHLWSHHSLPIAVMGFGAVALAVGNAVFLGGKPLADVVLLWAAFLLITIVGERLELAMLFTLRFPIVLSLFLLLAALFVGAGIGVSQFYPGLRLFSLSLLGLSVWLFLYDKPVQRAWRRGTGLPRFMGIALASGYGWLLVAGILGIALPIVPGDYYYDAFLHAIFLGFVFAMIFAHAPIILPAVGGVKIAFHPLFYLPLVLLHLSLLVRVFGDITGSFSLRLWGSLVNVVAILIFFGVVISSREKGKSSLVGKN